MSLLEKKVKMMLLTIGIVIVLVAVASSFSEKNERVIGGDLEGVLCNIEGIDEVSVVYSANDKDNRYWWSKDDL